MCRIVRRIYSCGKVLEQRYCTSGCGGVCANPNIETLTHNFPCDDASHAH